MKQLDGNNRFRVAEVGPRSHHRDIIEYQGLIERWGKLVVDLSGCLCFCGHHLFLCCSTLSYVV